MRPWASALALALTGEAFDLAPSESADPAAVLEALEGAGWPASRLRELATDRRCQGLPWPFPADRHTLRQLGSAAAYLAALAECERLAHADGLTAGTLADRPLNAAERRLLADVPPHFGHAG